MNNITMEGTYWKIEENEYNIQISFRPENKSELLNTFHNWSSIANGFDPSREEEIVILRKKFATRSDFMKMIRDLKRQQIIFLKEAV
jgi:hypothetical protein|tara:strand:- start:11947 stop:12207 length:261 start_codon:yes stop_codon:yes gene_type:complete